MITRRRGRMQLEVEEQPVEVEVCDGETSPTETFPSEDLDASIELDDIFGDLKWTLDRDGTEGLFDVDLAEFGIYGKERDSGREMSSASSPERRDADLKTRKSNPVHGLNKNAIAARLNRIKKKEYVNDLERKVTGLSNENSALKRENCDLTKRVEELEEETRATEATPATTTTRCLGNGRGLERRSAPAAEGECAFMWTGTMCLWNSAPSVQRARVQH